MTKRCEECGSYDSECSSPIPVKDCGCNRCLMASRKEFLDAIEDAWTQFAYDASPDGSGLKFAGGLSTLEWLIEILVDAKRWEQVSPERQVYRRVNLYERG